jgi:Rod binding domain-containing protein
MDIGAIGNPQALLEARDAGGGAEADTAKLPQAAQEFESLLLVQILRTARESGSGGWLGGGESQEMSSTLELAETQLARAMAQSGALGLTKLLAGELPPGKPDR